MKVLNCCQSDWANFSHDNANALRSVGVHCIDVKIYRHSFGYPDQSRIMTLHEIRHQMLHADVVQIMHSDLKMLSLAKDMDKKRIIVYHTGTAYRQGSKMMNQIFNPHVEKSVLALGEFAGLGAKNEVYMVGAIDTRQIAHTENADKVYAVAHYPSNKWKGSDTIERAIRDLHGQRQDFNFKMSRKTVDYDQQLKRMNGCDIYVELLSTHQMDKQYGSWGISALEAAAMGKIVVTCHTTESIYEEAYGVKTPFIVCHSEQELKDKLNHLLNQPLEEIRRLQGLSREWVVKYHSYKASGERIKWIINKN